MKGSLKIITGYVAKRTPAQLVVISYVIMILIGAVLLKLPVSSAAKPLSFLDAVFTSTSALCVTGLTVLDTGKDFSRTGQIIILSLIQAGGLGIMTLSSFLLFMAGKKVSLKSRRALRETFDQISQIKWRVLIASVILFTLFAELLGAILLYSVFRNDFIKEEAIFVSIFHSVSAFCNAGFSTFSDSLMHYYNNATVVFTVCLLIVVGGIGFFVVNELVYRLIKRRAGFKMFSLHTKLVLITTLVLIVSGTLFIFFFEYYNTLASLSFKDKIYVSIFQSITARTAGFNTLPVDKLTGSTLIIIMVLMFIGGSSGSTAGGIKTTTAAILFSIARAKILGVGRIFTFSRTLPNELVEKAVTISVVALFLISFGALLLLFSQYSYIPAKETESFFIRSVFEATSAFGTVGLSTGITASLNGFSKFVLIILMYIGRIGPLTLALALAEREIKSRLEYAEESVMIG